MDKNQLTVFRFLWQDPLQLSSISEVARRTKLAYPVAWKALKELEKKTLVYPFSFVFGFLNGKSQILVFPV